MFNLSTVSRALLGASNSGLVSDSGVTVSDSGVTVSNSSLVSDSGLGSLQNPDDLFVVLLGIGTVFVGLIALIIICKLMGLFFAGSSKRADAPAKAAPAAQPVAAAEIPNRQEMVAAISAVLAEEIGTDVSAIRIHSIKRV